jgi:hypothetical protein
MLPALETMPVKDVTVFSATSGGSIITDGGSRIVKQGICWDTLSNPTINNNIIVDSLSKSGFLQTITKLKSNKTYYVRAFATNYVGTGYGKDETFTTLSSSAPIVNTNNVTGISDVSVICGGTIVSDGNSSITSRGVCWSTSPGSTIASNKTSDGTGPGIYISKITGLTASTTYYVRAYATNSKGTTYGQDNIFTTAPVSFIITIPTLFSNVITSITNSSAVSGGVITSDGGSAITARGVCYSTTSGPTINSQKTSDGNGAGSFVSNLSGLTASTTYYVKAYATNSQGTAYGSEYSFTTAAVTLPTLTTTSATNLTSSSAVSGGNITSDGGATVTARGICWGTTTGPTIALTTKTSDGTGSGIFVSNLTGLNGLTTYYVRAYATNIKGTIYGNEISFVTAANLTVPVLFTNVLSAITTNSAVSGGVISSDGGSTITSRGVCWSTTTGPTISLSTKTNDGTGIGAFTSSISGLAANTTYYIRAYATNNTGTGYGLESSFTTAQPALAVLSTTAASNIGFATAVSGGVISSDGGAAVTARGVCYGTSANPTIASSKTTDGSGTGTFVSNISGLTASTTYHIRAYATTSAGTAYGNDASFATTAQPIGNTTPFVFTTAASSITSNSAVTGGNVTSDGGLPITVRGVCWSTTTGPTIALTTKTTDGTGAGTFVSNISGLTASTTYYVKAYATNSLGTSYGSEISFTTSATLSLPSIITNSVSSITTTSAVSGGNISSNGNATITASGVCWSTTANPTTANSKTNELALIGSFVSNLTGLVPSTTYHVRAYATNSVGTAYGNDISFTTATPLSAPTVTTTGITAITSSTASSGGNVTSDGGTAVTARGVCWSITTGPTINSSTTSDASGTGVFTSSLSGLAAGTTYYVRAYATNSVGTSYGSEISFTTSAPTVTLPTLTTTAASAITATTATSGGNISSDGGSAVTARGVCWATTANPTTSNSITTDGTGIGSFTSAITGLAGSTIYHVRAYATNSAGTVYGADVTFTTSTPPPANSTGTLSVSVLTVAPGGGYKPKNCVAIWIETNAGIFVKSLLVYANAQKKDLTTWYPNSAGNVVNATTAATQSSHGTRTCTWNGTDVSGAVVLDGTYKLCMNITDGSTVFSSFPFTKGLTAVTLTPANVAGFSNISISWVH